MKTKIEKYIKKYRLLFLAEILLFLLLYLSSIFITSIIIGWLFSVFSLLINVDVSNEIEYLAVILSFTSIFLFIFIQRTKFKEIFKARRYLYLAKTFEKRIYLEGELISAADFITNKYAHYKDFENNFFTSLYHKLKNINQFKAVHYRSFLIPFINFTVLCVFLVIGSLAFTYGPDEYLNGEFPSEKIIKAKENKNEIYFYLEYPKMIIHGKESEFILKSNCDKQYLEFYFKDGKETHKLDNEKFVLESPDEDFSFKAILYKNNKKSQSKIHNVKIHRLPILENIEIEYSYPKEYRLRNKIIKDNGYIECFKNTKIKMKLKTNQNLNSAILYLKNTKKEIKFNTNNNLATTEFIAQTNDEYSIVLKDNLDFKNENDITYNINIIKDRKPTVNIVAPDSILYINEKTKLKTIIESFDDFGLKSISIIYKIIDTKKKNKIYSSSNKISIKDKFASISKNLSIVENRLKGGQTLLYYAIASDIKNQTAKSKTHKIIFQSMQEQIKKENIQQKKNFDDIITEQKRLKNEIKNTVDKMSMGDVKPEDNKKLEDLIEREKQLAGKIANEIDKIKEIEDKLKTNEDDLSKEILSKSEQIKELLKEILDQKTKENLNLLEKALQNLNKKNRNLNDLKTNEQNQKQQLKKLEKTLEMLELLKEMQELYFAKKKY